MTSQLTLNCTICSKYFLRNFVLYKFSQKLLTIETQVKRFLGKYQKGYFDNKKFNYNWSCNDDATSRFLCILSILSMIVLFLNASNSLFDVIMLSGTIKVKQG